MSSGFERAFWQDRPTLVTGGTGFLGSRLVQRLVRDGAQVVCQVRDWVPESELVRSRTIDRVRIVRGDVRDRECLERTLGEFEITTVIHLAGQAIAGIANRNPISTFETNIGGTWTLLEACRRTPTIKAIVVASSDKAYGAHGQLPYREDHALNGRHPYDVSKSCADLIAQAYAATYGLPVAITRCGNFYGGGDLNFNRIVPGTIRSVLRGERPIIRSDGLYVRDYLHVDDGVEAHVLLARRLAADPGLSGHAFNFANETRVTVLELVQRILGLAGSDLEPRVLNEATNEIREQYVSNDKAREILHWAPRFSLDAGLARTIEWYRERLAMVVGERSSLNGTAIAQSA